MRGALDRARGLLRVVRLLSARQLREHPLRTALTASGVALGVTLYVAVLILNCSTLRYFDDTARAVAGRARLTVVADQAGFPEEVLERVSAVPGVATAVPLVEARATYLEAPGAPPRILMVLGVDLLRETAVRSYRADDQTVVDDPLAFLNQPDSIVLTRAFARAQGLELDSKIDLLTAGGRKRFTVRGLLEPSGPAVAYGGGLALMDVDAARVMFGRQGRTDRIDVVPREGEDDVALEHRLERALGPGFRVERPETQVDAFERMLGSYQAVLSAFGSLALLVGLLLVANALGIAVVERRREIGLLRAVGASRAAIVVGLLGEGALLGAVGGLGGLAAGWGLARALVGMVSRGLTAQFVTPIYVESLRYEPRQAVTALLLGV
ncbi:MAG: ABC transporter permease, partial [Polyangia bacterium]